MQRVMIIGQPGSGKSTFACRMGERTGLPVVHIDKIHYEDGWVERSQAEKTARCEEVHARETWIFEGGHSRTLPQRMLRADTVIWLDFPFPRRLARVIIRTFRYLGRPRPDMPEGCPERFNWEFLSYIWSTRKSNRETIQRLVSFLPEGTDLHILRDLKEIQAYLDSLAPVINEDTSS